MTNGELKLFERWKDQFAAQLTILSGQIEDIKRDMVTRREYNEAHEPLIQMVKEHDRVYQWGKRYWNRLAWIGLASIWLSPHVVPMVRDIVDWLKGVTK